MNKIAKAAIARAFFPLNNKIARRPRCLRWPRPWRLNQIFRRAQINRPKLHRRVQSAIGRLQASPWRRRKPRAKLG